MNLKNYLDAVLGESGFIQKDSYAQTADPDDKQMVAIANRVATDMMEWCQWSILRKSHTITMLDATTTYDLPDDLLSIVPDSVWDTDGSRRVELPVSPNRWYMYKYSTLSDAGMVRARIYGSTIELYDSDPGESFSFEYISKYPIVDEAGTTPKQLFTLDTDHFILDENTLIKGIQAKWALTKMLPQSQEWAADYLVDLGRSKARDTGGKTIGGVPSSYGDGLRGAPYYPLWRSS